MVSKRVDAGTTGTTIHGVRGGERPPVLLLHGIHETRLMWHQVAPQLASRYTVVANGEVFGGGRQGPRARAWVWSFLCPEPVPERLIWVRRTWS